MSDGSLSDVSGEAGPRRRNQSGAAPALGASRLPTATWDWSVPCLGAAAERTSAWDVTAHPQHLPASSPAPSARKVCEQTVGRERSVTARAACRPLWPHTVASASGVCYCRQGQAHLQASRGGLAGTG